MLHIKNLDVKSVLSDLTNTHSILLKMVAMFFLLMIIPLSVSGFISSKTASEYLLESAEDSLKGATYQASNNYDYFLDKALNMSLQVLSNESILKLAKLDEQSDSAEKQKVQKAAADALSNIDSATLDMNSKVLFNTGHVLGRMTPPENMAKVFETGWYKKVLDANGAACWLNDYNEATKSTTEYALSLVRLYKTSATSKPSGIIIIDINYAAVANILKSIDLGKDESSYLLTPDGKVISEQGEFEKENLSERQFIKEVTGHLKEAESGLFSTTDNRIKYLVSYFKSPKTGMTVITIVPSSSITAGASQIIKTTVLFAIIFLLIAVIIGFAFSLQMTASMKSLMAAMSKAEKGDLSVSLKMKRKDEIGKLTGSFNEMIANIRELVIQSKNAAEDVAASSQRMASISAESSRISSEIAQAIVDVASGSSTQASEIDTSVRNVSQLTDRISRAVEKTQDMQSDSELMRELSDTGITTIDSLNQKTIRTNEITSSVVKEIEQLNQYVKNINVITNVLRSIADQTNLLALNATIEAAKAGTAGKGFSVVANEVKKLADQSNNRTREIQKHIENIYKQTQISTDLVLKTEESIKEQSEMVAQTAEAFSRINSITISLGDNINKVGSMITDMNSYKEMVMSCMENISAVSDEVSASTEEVSASTEEQLRSVEQLDEMAKQLNELAYSLISKMEKFKI